MGGSGCAVVKAVARWWSAILCTLLAMTAIPGAIALWSGSLVPPSALLAGSPFSSYAVPAAALFGVGLLAAAAARANIADDDRRRALSAMTGLGLVIFELVEIAVIGSPTGPAQWMQMFFFALGFTLIGLAVVKMSPH